MNVNLSAKQLQHAGIVADVRAALDASGLAPERLVLELTESRAARGRRRWPSSACNALKALGVAARAGRLRHRLLVAELPAAGCPVDILKLDRSFLRDGAAAR